VRAEQQGFRAGRPLEAADDVAGVILAHRETRAAHPATDERVRRFIAGKERYA